MNHYVENALEAARLREQAQQHRNRAQALRENHPGVCPSWVSCDVGMEELWAREADAKAAGLEGKA